MRRMVWALALIAGMVSSAGAASANGIKDVYKGMIVEEGLPQTLMLTLLNVSQGDKDNYLRFNRPRDCIMEFEYATEYQGEHFLYLVGGSSRNYCKRFNGKKTLLRIKQESSKSIKVRLMDGDKLFEEYTLTR